MKQRKVASFAVFWFSFISVKCPMITVPPIILLHFSYIASTSQGTLQERSDVFCSIKWNMALHPYKYELTSVSQAACCVLDSPPCSASTTLRRPSGWRAWCLMVEVFAPRASLCLQVIRPVHMSSSNPKPIWDIWLFSSATSCQRRWLIGK